MTCRRAWLSGTIDAPRFRENPCATRITPIIATRGRAGTYPAAALDQEAIEAYWAQFRSRVDGSHAMRVLLCLSAAALPALANADVCREHTESLLLRLAQEVRPALSGEQLTQVARLARAVCDETVAAAPLAGHCDAVGRDPGQSANQAAQQPAMPDFWDYLLMDTGGKPGNQRLRKLK